MKSDQQQPCWKRRQSLSAGEAFMLGLVVGSAAAIAAAFNPPRDFSWSFLSLLLLSLGPCGGIAGYILWLGFHPERERWLRTITTFIAVPLILGLLVAIPSFWQEMARVIGAQMVGMFVGFIFAATAFFVAAGLAFVHFVGYLACAVRGSAKARISAPTCGVWDREFDQG